MIEVNRKRWGYVPISSDCMLSIMLNHIKEKGDTPCYYVNWREKLGYVLNKVYISDDFRSVRGLFRYTYLIVYMDYNSKYISHCTLTEAERILKLARL